MPEIGQQRRRFFHSIRFQLLLISLTLLLIPWAGYRYLQEIELLLRQSQQEKLQITAQATAVILRGFEEMFVAGSLDAEANASAHYVYPLQQRIELDGYAEEWQSYLLRAQPFGTGDGSFRAVIGERDETLYLLFKVEDGQRVYRRPGSSSTEQSDTVELALERPDGTLTRYRITTTSPGWANVERWQNGAWRSEQLIRGEWQPNPQGYTVELRIPRYLIGDRIAFAVIDVDDPVLRRQRSRIASGSMQQARQLGRLISPDPELADAVRFLIEHNSRLTVLDNRQRVLAREGQLDAPVTGEETIPLPSLWGRVKALLFQLILEQPDEDEFAGQSTINLPEVTAALAGRPEVQRRSDPTGNRVILSATWPVRSPDGIIGAVLVEQSTRRILSLYDEAIERLALISILLFSITALTLLLFATLLAARIRRLRNRVEAAISPDGRIIGELPAGGSRDEIGDLNRSFSAVLQRLSEYNHYLEAMASRLTHELRTPLTVVKSSLESLQQQPMREGQQRYLQRAEQGAQRLGLILERMREATRLEQLLQQVELEPVDLIELCRLSIEGYRDIFPACTFELLHDPSPIEIFASPELICQALDKLISNAVDFHQEGTPITVEVRRSSAHQASLILSNRGPTLPAGDENRLFQSLISIRQTTNGEPHLGLGLYLVQLIINAHGGEVTARNLADGVAFEARLPTLKA